MDEFTNANNLGKLTHKQNMKGSPHKRSHTISVDNLASYQESMLFEQENTVIDPEQIQEYKWDLVDSFNNAHKT